MRRYLTLVFLLCLSIPAGISFSGCTRNPAGNYCNGSGYGLKITDVVSIDLEPRTQGVSLAYGQTRQITPPTAKTCKGTAASVAAYTYGTTNNQLVDISPLGNMCAGTWNRNSGGGIADYTICNFPKPLPNTNGLPFSTAFISASAQSVTSNPVEVFIHAQVSSINLALAGTQQCYSQGAIAQLDSEACYAANNTQYEFCAPSTVTNYSCPGGLAPGVTSVPNCSAAIGTMSYTIGTSTIASLNSVTNQITAEQPGTTLITASVAGSGSSAGYFSVCPPKSITVTLNGQEFGIVTLGVAQNMVTTVTDTLGQPITGLTLDYQSTNPIDIVAGAGGAISPIFPGTASVYAICQPSTCNPSPINEVGVFGTGLSISSNPVTVTTPGTASSFVWFAAPGKSQYFVPVDLQAGTLGSTVRMPYVPNSMVLDQTGSNLYFGSLRELMVYNTLTNSLAKQDPNVPGVVLSVSPNNKTLLINDQVRKVFYLYSTAGTVIGTFGGVGNASSWTPDSKTLYVTDSASLGPNHSDTLYVFNANTGWTTYSLASSGGSDSVAVTIPGVGAYMSGYPTVAHTWCPSGPVADYQNLIFYPQGDSVPTQTDTLATTTDGQHILGAAMVGGGVQLSDIGLTFPTATVNGIKAPLPCQSSGNTLLPLEITHTLNQIDVSGVSATQVNQIVASPASTLAFITYNGTTPNAKLPYYVPVSGGAAGTLSYLTLTGSSAITAPVAGAFSPDNAMFFLSTAGDNMIHYITIPKTVNSSTPPVDSQQVSPNLPACVPGSDPNCTLTSPVSGPVPATVVVVKPRSTT